MKRTYLLMLCIFFSYLSRAQYSIQGHISGNVENKVAYLDIIDSWDGFNSISIEMILKKSIIDSHGNYSFSGNELSEKIGYYRIRIEDHKNPPVSISSDRSIYFLMTNKDTISIQDKYTINDVWENLELMNISKKLDSLNYLIDYAKNQRIKELLIEKKEIFLTEKVKSSEKSMIAMLSAYYKKERDEDYIAYVSKIANNLNNSKYRSVYKSSMDKFIGQQNYNQLYRKNRIQYYFLVFSLVINLMILAFFGFNYFKRKKKSKSLQWEDLTKKELQILELIANGKSNKEMAEVLFVSENTIKSHVNNIYRKAGIQSRKEAINLHNKKKSTQV